MCSIDNTCKYHLCETNKFVDVIDISTEKKLHSYNHIEECKNIYTESMYDN